MYAIVKTGGKQYKVEPGTVLSIEKLDAEVGDEVELPVICVVDGDTIEADPEKAAATKVVAVVLDQFKDKKKIIFKFKKRKGYKKLRGHRQPMTRVRITAVGTEKYVKKARKAEEAEEKAEEAVKAAEEAAEAAAVSVEEAAEELAEAIQEAADEETAAPEAPVEAVEEAAEEAAEETASQDAE